MFSLKVALVFLLSLFVMVQAAPRPPNRPPPHRPCKYYCPRAGWGRLTQSNEYGNSAVLACYYKGGRDHRGHGDDHRDDHRDRRVERCYYGRFTGRLIRGDRKCPRQARNPNRCRDRHDGHDGHDNNHHKRAEDEGDAVVDVVDGGDDAGDDGDDAE